MSRRSDLEPARAELVPALDLSARPRYPVLAALYHPPGGIVRHDAVVWAYAREAARRGVEIHQFTEAVGTDVAEGRVTGGRTSRGAVRTGAVLNATAGLCSTVARLVGLRLPVVTHPRRPRHRAAAPVPGQGDRLGQPARLREPDRRGECVIGSEIDPYPSYSHRSTLPFLELTAHHALELFPCLRTVRVLRQWTGICDMAPDYSPIMGAVPGLRGFYLDVRDLRLQGRAGGRADDRGADRHRADPLIRPFAPSRFQDGRLVGEKAAAAVSWSQAGAPVAPPGGA